MDKETKKLIFVGITVGVALFLIKRGVASGAAAIGEAITPTNPDNIFARGVNAVGDIFDDGVDDDSFSLGGFIFDLVNRKEIDG